MPGYRDIPDDWSGLVVDGARMAERLEASGDATAAIIAYEAVLRAALAVRPEWPGFVCGRLATLYRKVGRYGDEVTLLEGCCGSQTNDAERLRFQSRLSKARELEFQKARRDSGALASIRAIRPNSAKRNWKSDNPL